MRSIVAFVVVVFAFMVASCSSSDPVASKQTKSVNNSINSLPAANANTPGSANTSTVSQFRATSRLRPTRPRTSGVHEWTLYEKMPRTRTRQS